MGTNGKVLGYLVLASLVLVVCLVLVKVSSDRGIDRESPSIVQVENGGGNGGLEDESAAAPPDSSAEKPPVLRGEEAESDTMVDNKGADANLIPLNAEIYTESEYSMDKALYVRKYSDPREFVKLVWFGGIPYRQARRLIKKDKLPLLYKMLGDSHYSNDWHKIARLIGYVSEDVNSVPLLLEYFERDDSWNWKGIEENGLGHTKLLGKIDALQWLGTIGGPLSDKVLREAITEEGAARLAKAWLGDGLLTTSSLFNTAANTIVLIRGRAAMGLALTTKPKNIDLLKQFYEEEAASCRSNKKKTLLYSEFVSAMVVQDFIATNDREAYLNLLGTPEPRLTALRPYWMKLKQHFKKMPDIDR